MSGWEALWARQRDAVVQRVEANHWGLSADGRTVTGPAGFAIDLSKCPPGWSNTEGLTDGGIAIGQTIPESGPSADYGYIGKAVAAILDHYSGKGAFTDVLGKSRKVRYVVRDDGGDPDRTLRAVDELIDSDKVFDVWTLGSANTLPVYDKLNERCIPDVLTMSAHPAWGDPVGHPWTTGLQLSYTTEALLWAGFVEQHLHELADRSSSGGAAAGVVTVGSLVASDGIGPLYQAAFRAALAQSPDGDRIRDVSETVAAGSSTTAAAMAALARSDPDVLLVMAGGSACTEAVAEAARDGMKGRITYRFVSSACQSSGFEPASKVGGDGSAADGWWVVGSGVKDLQSSAYGKDPFIAWVRDVLAQDGLDYRASSSLGAGVLFGWSMAQALQIAGRLDGGLTRANLIVALRATEMSNPMLLPGVGYRMDGDADAYLIEGARFARFDASKQRWVAHGAVVDRSGRTDDCSWDPDAGTCR
jgi:branched-chain amino acid transport system substrate-binding protein